MLCPKCGDSTKVCDTRYERKENEVYRRHICRDCMHEFYTIEFEVENNNKFNDLWKKLARGSGTKIVLSRNE